MDGSFSPFDSLYGTDPINASVSGDLVTSNHPVHGVFSDRHAELDPEPDRPFWPYTNILGTRGHFLSM